MQPETAQEDASISVLATLKILVRDRGFEGQWKEESDVEIDLLGNGQGSIQVWSIPMARPVTLDLSAVETVDNKNQKSNNSSSSNNNNNNRGCVVMICANTKISVDLIRSCLEAVKDLKADQIIVVYHAEKESISSIALKEADKIRKQVHLTFFYDHQLKKPYVQHALVPPHRRVPPDEVDEYLKQRRLSLEELGTIAVTDPIIQWYGWRPGDVIEVTRFFGALAPNVRVERIVP